MLYRWTDETANIRKVLEWDDEDRYFIYWEEENNSLTRRAEVVSAAEAIDRAVLFNPATTKRERDYAAGMNPECTRLVRSEEENEQE
jgi:hypothetical protein